MSAFNIIVVLVLVIPLGLAGWARWRVRSIFREADRVENAGHLNGLDAARRLLDQSGLHSVSVEVGDAILMGDAYDPIDKRLFITDHTAWHRTDLSMGVVGHEVGHATQDAQGFRLMRVRETLARWLMQLSWVSPFFFIGGFLLGIVAFMWVAVGVMALQVLFAVITLPVEIDASRRAVDLLERGRVIAAAEERAVRRVLRAAAFTYIASVGVRIAFFSFWVIVLVVLTGVWLPR